MDLEDIRQILDLVREHELAEFELERDGLKVRIRKAGNEVTFVAPATHAVAPVPVLAAPSSPSAGLGPVAATAAPGAADAVDLAIIKSPIVGTFYRSPEPGAPNFVEVGAHVKKGQVLCIIEAMKLMNEIDSEYDGEVTNIYVEGGQSVQYGERLFAIRTK